MSELQETLQKLIRASEKCYPNPYASLQWPERLEPDAEWYTSPELLSVYGTPVYDRMSEAQRKRLSFYEAVNFYCINIHGEKIFVEGGVHRLYGCADEEVTRYLHHFVDEENKHLAYFGKFCLRYAGKIYPSREGTAIRRDFQPGEEDFLFFSRVLISEEIIEVYNGAMANDARLHPLAREINYLHHRDEARHRLFGRQYIRELYRRHSPGWSDQTRRDLGEFLRRCVERAWAMYYNPEVYRDAGFDRPESVREEVYAHPAAREHRRSRTKEFIEFLSANGILDREPEW